MNELTTLKRIFWVEWTTKRHTNCFSGSKTAYFWKYAMLNLRKSLFCTMQKGGTLWVTPLTRADKSVSCRQGKAQHDDKNGLSYKDEQDERHLQTRQSPTWRQAWAEVRGRTRASSADKAKPNMTTRMGWECMCGHILIVHCWSPPPLFFFFFFSLLLSFLFFLIVPFLFLVFLFFLGNLCKHKNSLAGRPAIIIIISVGL